MSIERIPVGGGLIAVMVVVSEAKQAKLIVPESPLLSQNEIWRILKCYRKFMYLNEKNIPPTL